MPPLLAPRFWGGHLLAVALLVAAALLGAWQLDAWEERRAAEARDLTQAEPVPLADVLGPDDPFPAAGVGRPVELDGTWVPDGTVYVSGRERAGHDGYWMVTPLAVGSPDASAIPVVLGWLDDPGRAPVPPTGEQRLVGLLQASEGPGEPDPDPTDDVLPALRVADLVQHVDQDLYGGYAVARDGVAGLPAADLEELPSPDRFTAVRNLLYAIEWWVFGAFAGFVWWQWVRDSRADAAQAAAAMGSGQAR